MKFSTGQLIFALIFAISFIVALILMYKKDLKQVKIQYKGTKWILLGFLIFIGILFMIKLIIKD